jgi:hypothetical protein
MGFQNFFYSKPMLFTGFLHLIEDVLTNNTQVQNPMDFYIIVLDLSDIAHFGSPSSVLKSYPCSA